MEIPKFQFEIFQIFFWDIKTSYMKTIENKNWKLKLFSKPLIFFQTRQVQDTFKKYPLKIITLRSNKNPNNPSYFYGYIFLQPNQWQRTEKVQKKHCLKCLKSPWKHCIEVHLVFALVVVVAILILLDKLFTSGVRLSNCSSDDSAVPK